jgi:hypothetical protein
MRETMSSCEPNDEAALGNLATFAALDEDDPI